MIQTSHPTIFPLLFPSLTTCLSSSFSSSSPLHPLAYPTQTTSQNPPPTNPTTYILLCMPACRPLPPVMQRDRRNHTHIPTRRVRNSSEKAGPRHSVHTLILPSFRNGMGQGTARQSSAQGRAGKLGGVIVILTRVTMVVTYSPLLYSGRNEPHVTINQRNDRHLSHHGRK